MTHETLAIKEVDYEQPASATDGAVCATKHAWARVPVEPTQTERTALKAHIRQLLKQHNAVMVSHYYVHPDLQDLAEETGGLVSDSLEMARFGPRPQRQHPGGVRGEIHGRNLQDPVAPQTCADAGPGCQLLT
jgi:hypothetical protein